MSSFHLFSITFLLRTSIFSNFFILPSPRLEGEGISRFEGAKEQTPHAKAQRREGAKETKQFPLANLCAFAPWREVFLFF
jgi:hypothetical protein